MPMLMEKSDRLRTVDRVCTTDRVWFDTIATHAGAISFNVPEAGNYQVILVNIDEPQESKPRRRSAREMIGYCRKYHPEYRSTEDIMKELREGEED